MSFIEFIGFIISFAAMIFLVIRRFFEERQRRLNPEEYAKRERLREQNLRKFLKSRDLYSPPEEEEEEQEEEDEEEVLKPVKPKKFNMPPKTPAVTQQQAFIKLREAQKQQVIQQKSPAVQQGNYGSETAKDKKRNLTAADAARYSQYDLKSAESYEVIHIEKKVTAAQRLLSSLKSPQDMLVIKEIFDKPLSMRHPQD